jgi:DegV family protein with EDD domain
MGKVKVFTDSTSDLSQELITQNDIGVVPLYVCFNNNSYRDGVDIFPEDVLEKVKKDGALPTTSAPSPGDFYDAFKSYVDQGQDIVYIGLSSKISATMQNVHIAASQFPVGHVYVVDSLNLSTGIGLLVMKAVEYAREGMSAEEIVTNVEKLIPKVRTEFIIDTLDYLYKGGRCSVLQSIFGSILKIHPIVAVSEGKMILSGKVRGKRQRIVAQLLENALQNAENMDMDRIFITHAMSDEDAKLLKEELEKNVKAKDVIITTAGCVIFSHCGPGTVGILYIEK